MKNVYFYDFPIGTLGICEENATIHRIYFSNEKTLFGYELLETPLICEAARQLNSYFLGTLVNFDLPITFTSTKFQQLVYNALRAIPAGETRSYKEIAKMIGKPNASRAVGMANHRNPLMIIIPCHRVVGGDGSLVGYVGGIEAKKYLLNLEKHHG